MMSCESPCEDCLGCGCAEVLAEPSSCLPSWLRHGLVLAFLVLPTVLAARWLTARHHLDRAKKKLRCLRVANPSLRKQLQCLLKKPSKDAMAGTLKKKREALLQVRRSTCFSEESASRLEKLRCLKLSLQEELDGLQRETCSLQEDLDTLQSVFNKIRN